MVSDVRRARESFREAQRWRRVDDGAIRDAKAAVIGNQPCMIFLDRMMQPMSGWQRQRLAETVLANSAVVAIAACVLAARSSSVAPPRPKPSQGERMSAVVHEPC